MSLPVKGHMGMNKKFKIAMKKLLFTIHMMKGMSKGSTEKNFQEAIRVVEGAREDDEDTKFSF